jgi:acetyl-CoA carboxylase biotin carboxyl carrier protein
VAETPSGRPDDLDGETPRPSDRPSAARSDEARRADHAAIERLADDLLPALAAKLDASELGELEVREGGWRVRIRRSQRQDASDAQGGAGHGRRSTDRTARAQPGHAGHGHAPAAMEGHLPIRQSTNGSQPVPATVGPSHDEPRGPRAPTRASGERRLVATSPAVGVFQPSRDVSRGSRVRSGDRLAIVDVLGVPAEVVAPADAIVGATLVEAGDAVEYGQALIELDRIEVDIARTRPGEAGEG